MLADRSTTSLATTDNLAVAIGELLQQLDVFVVNVSRTGTFAVNEKRILTNGLRLELWFTA